MDKDKETEEKKLRDLPPVKDAKGGNAGTDPTPMPVQGPWDTTKLRFATAQPAQPPIKK